MKLTLVLSSLFLAPFTYAYGSAAAAGTVGREAGAASAAAEGSAARAAGLAGDSSALAADNAAEVAALRAKPSVAETNPNTAPKAADVAGGNGKPIVDSESASDTGSVVVKEELGHVSSDPTKIPTTEPEKKWFQLSDQAKTNAKWAVGSGVAGIGIGAGGMVLAEHISEKKANDSGPKPNRR